MSVFIDWNMHLSSHAWNTNKHAINSQRHVYNRKVGYEQDLNTQFLRKNIIAGLLYIIGTQTS